MRRSRPACGQVTILLGAYTLGGLRGHQETQVRAHLSHCARCRAEAEQLAEVPAFLDLITAEEAAAAEGPLGQAPAVGERVTKSAEQAASDGVGGYPLLAERGAPATGGTDPSFPHSIAVPACQLCTDSIADASEKSLRWTNDGA
jgi:anti-sigma factor RsiW